MPLPVHSRTSEISRQFTDSERAVDSRIDEHLQAPSVQMRTGRTIGQSYKWLQEDMALRSTMTEQLGREEALAVTQSARHALHDQAVQQEKDDQEALDGLTQLNGHISSGMTLPEARQKVVESNPNLNLNGKFAAGTVEAEKYFETDETRKLQKLKEANEALKLGSENFSMEAMKQWHEQNPQVMDETVKQLQDRHKALGLTAANSVEAARLAEFQTVQGLRESEIIRQQWKDNPDGISLDTLAGLQNSFDDVGLSGVQDIPRAIKRYGSSKAISGVLTDARWLNTNLPDPAAREELVKAINTATDDNAKPEDRKAADNTLLRLGGKYMRDTQRAAKWNEDQDKLKEISKGFQTSYDAVSKEVTGILTAAGSAKLPDKGASAILSAARGFVSQGIGTDAATDAAAREYQGYFDKLPKTMKPSEAAATARDLMSAFAGKAREGRLAAAASPQAVAKTAGETPVAPASNIPQPGEVRGGYTFKGGDPADKSNWIKN